MDFYTTVLHQFTYYPRVYVALRVLTVLGQQTIPQPIMNGLGLALIFVLPEPTAEQVLAWSQTGGLVFLGLKEAMLGFLIGYVFSLVFALAETAGQFMDNPSGLTFSQNIDPVNGNQTSPTGVLLTQLAYMVFWATGGMLLFIRTLYDSYIWWPTWATSPRLAATIGLQAGTWVGHWFGMALMVAAAVMIILFLVDFGFGLLGRAAPNINLGQLTFTFKGLIVVAVLALSIQIFADSVQASLKFVAAAIENIFTSHAW